MARNAEKQYGKLNRLILFKEREDYEKAHPKRPKLDTLDTVEEVKQWLPSIKRDLDFYLKKSQVTCYSDTQIDECREMVCKLEREFKAYVRKIRHLTPGKLDVIPWTNRPYKRKNSVPVQTLVKKTFTPILTPILSSDKPREQRIYQNVCTLLMDKPLDFGSCSASKDSLNGINTSVNAVKLCGEDSSPRFQEDQPNSHLFSAENCLHHLNESDSTMFALKNNNDSLSEENIHRKFDCKNCVSDIDDKNTTLQKKFKSESVKYKQLATLNNQSNILGIDYSDSSDGDSSNSFKPDSD